MYKFPENGQGTIMIINANDTVSCGVANRKDVPIEEMFVREHRGEPIICAPRKYAAPVKSLNAIVYTSKAYFQQSNVLPPGEMERVGDADLILIAVLADAGNGVPPLTSHRFVRNLAGGNPLYTPQSGYTIEKAILESALIVLYEQNWITVAD